MLTYIDRISLKDRFLDAFYQRNVYRVRCDINRTVLTTPCIGLDKEKEFSKHLKTVSGVVITPKQDDFYVKVTATELTARKGIVERIARFIRFFCFWISSPAVPFPKPDLSLLPSNVFLGGKENHMTRFYADSRLVEMTLMQEQSPYPYPDWKAPFEKVFTSLTDQRKPYYQPGYECILYDYDKDRPEGLLHIWGYVLSEEARVWDLNASIWKNCDKETCLEFERNMQRGYTPCFPHLKKEIKEDVFNIEFSACGKFETFKVLVDKGMIRIAAERVKEELAPGWKNVSRSPHFESPLHHKISVFDPTKKFDRDSLKFNLKDGILSVQGCLVPAV